MRINIKGNNPITSEQFKKVIDDLNAEYITDGLESQKYDLLCSVCR